MDNLAANETPFSFIEEGDNYAKFGQEFIRRYLATGFGSLPKSEIDLLVLELLYGPWKGHRDKNMNQQDRAHDSIFELAQKLKISPRRLKLKLDVLAFRQPPENPREKLREILKNGEKQNDGNKVRIQVSDGYVRAHAQDLVRRNLGIVDTSFNTEIISLSPDQFLLLVDDALSNETGDQKNKDEIKELLNQVKSEWLNAQAEDKPLPDPWTILKEAFAKGAGGALGQKTVDLGITVLRGGNVDIGQIVSLAKKALHRAEPGSDLDAYPGPP